MHRYLEKNILGASNNRIQIAKLPLKKNYTYCNFEKKENMRWRNWPDALIVVYIRASLADTPNFKPQTRVSRAPQRGFGVRKTHTPFRYDI
jgi:hypothetical protein